jgi:hypothetical protein
MHPIFKSILDGFVSIPEKIAAASVAGVHNSPAATPDNAGNLGGDRQTVSQICDCSRFGGPTHHESCAIWKR